MAGKFLGGAGGIMGGVMGAATLIKILSATTGLGNTTLAQLAGSVLGGGKGGGMGRGMGGGGKGGGMGGGMSKGQGRVIQGGDQGSLAESLITAMKELKELKKPAAAAQQGGQPQPAVPTAGQGAGMGRGSAGHGAAGKGAGTGKGPGAGKGRGKRGRKSAASQTSDVSGQLVSTVTEHLSLPDAGADGISDAVIVEENTVPAVRHTAEQVQTQTESQEAARQEAALQEDQLALASLAQHIVSFVDGRVRVRHAGLASDEAAQALTTLLQANGITASFSPRGSSALLTYDAAKLDRAGLLLHALPLARYLRNCDCALERVTNTENQR